MNRRLKLIYYSTAYFSAHGGASHSRAFVKEAERHPLVEEVIVFPQQSAAGRQVKNGARARKILRSISLLQVFFFYRRNTFYLKQLCELIELKRPDVILLRLDSNFMQLKYLRNRYPSLVIATEVNASPFDESFGNIAFKVLFRKLERRCLGVSHFNFFVSTHLKQKIIGNSTRNERDFVVHNGVDTDIFKPSVQKAVLRESLGIPSDKFVFGYIGTLDIHKNMDVLLMAFYEFTKHEPDCLLIIGGDGPVLSSLKKKANHLQIQDRIIFTSWIEHRNVPDYLGIFDVGVHHHANDYMSPLKIFEYMASGLPVIAPDVPSVREIFTDTDQVLFTKGTTEDLQTKMRVLFENVSLRNSVAKNGRDLVVRHFTWRANADLIISNMHRKVIG